MRAVAIDSATVRASVALWEAPRTVVLHSSDDLSHASERLVGLINAAFSDAGWSRRDVDLVICGIGPGSFTGTRAGLAAAKGLALGLGAPIVGVTSLETLAFALRPEDDSAPLVLSVLDAQRGEVFVGLFDRQGVSRRPPSHVPLARAATAMEGVDLGGVVAVGRAASLIEVSGLRVHRGERTDAPDIRAVAELGAARFAARGPDSLETLDAFYVRPPDITLPKAP